MVLDVFHFFKMSKCDEYRWEGEDEIDMSGFDSDEDDQHSSDISRLSANQGDHNNPSREVWGNLEILSLSYNI